MAAPRPIDIAPIVHTGPSAADIASRIVQADPAKQAEAQAKISFAHHQKQVAATLQTQPITNEGREEVPVNGNVKITGFAIVKSVPQADTLVLIGSGPADKAPPEKTLILSGIVVPRLARRKDSADEPYAFQAKEFIRRLVIGKRVKFTVTYVHGESGREYGSAELESVGDLAEKLIEEGWGKVKLPKEQTGKNKDKEAKVRPEQEALLAKEAAAVQAKKGMHGAANLASAIRTVEYLSASNEIREFFNANRGKTLNCIVEHVREGSSLRLELPGKTHKLFLLHLAGAQAPRIPATKPTGSPKHSMTEKPEPYAVDAQMFTAQRLLNRDVNVAVLGCDKLGNLFGSVSVAQGDIAVVLLSKGLAKYIDWSASLTPNKAELQAAELSAKQQKLRLWSKFEAPQSAEDIRGKQFSAKVIQIIGADTLLVEDGLKKEHRISLSSVRTPRPPYKERAAEPWAAEGKEFMRKRLIGKKVKISVDYVRSGSADAKEQEMRVFASVFHGKDNMAEILLANGLASVIRHRMDEERSAFYEVLQLAEEKAAIAKKGIHGPDPPASAHPVVDLSERVRIPPKGASEDVLRKQRDLTIKTKQFFSSIQRLGRVKAIVEFVFNGGRIKVYVPSESHVFTFMLSCIRLPGVRGEAADPLAQEASDFIRSRILQQEVEIEVESMDKGDNFLGSLFIERKNLSLLLLERGLARLVPRASERSQYGKELILFEEAAKKSRVGIWHDYDIEAEKAKAEEKAAAYRKQKEEERSQEIIEQQQALQFTCTISEIFDPLNFYFQKVNDQNLPKIEAALKALSPYKGPEFLPKRGFSCLAQFEDGTWYRAKVEKNILKGLYMVFFIDYGNRAEVTSVRPVPDNVPILKSHACAHFAQLSGIKLSNDYSEFANELFQEQIWEKQLQAYVDVVDRDSGKSHVTLTVLDEASGEKAEISVNEYLVRSGAARVPSRPARGLRHVIDKLMAAERAAKNDHRGIWEYGDVSSDEDEDNVKSKDKRR